MAEHNSQLVDEIKANMGVGVPVHWENKTQVCMTFSNHKLEAAKEIAASNGYEATQEEAVKCSDPMTHYTVVFTKA